MAVQDSTFKTTHVMDNEIIKANDFEFAFEQLVENVAKATQMFLESTQDFVINGKVIQANPLNPDMNVRVSPIYGVCKSTGKPFGRTETTDETIGFAGSSSGRIDIIEVQGDWETYDNQQRAFNDPDTDTQTYQYVDTKKLMKPVYQVKEGVEGAGVAPDVDEGWVKLAEISIRAGATSILATDIHNITADVAGLENEDWTNEEDITYNIGYISDVNERFRVQHEEDGTHSENCINAVSLDIGTGVNQINGNVLPVGGTVSIPTQTIAATDSILSVITKAALMITSLYNNYLKYGTYGFKGVLEISSVADANNDLTNPISISADGSGNAVIKIGNTTALTIDSTGKLSTNGYVAGSANNIVTKAVTDALQSALTSLTNRVSNIENTMDNTVYSNGVLSDGNDGRYNVDNTTIVAATTANITLSGLQTIDGVTVNADDLVFVKNQTDAKENGIYKASNTIWQRGDNFTTPDDLKGKLFTISGGTTNGKKIFYLPKVNFTYPVDNPGFGYDDINFLQYFASVHPIANKHVLRDSNGCAKTAEPNQANDCVTKNYVDPIVVTTNTKVISGPVLKNGMSLKFLFTVDITGTDDTTALAVTYNGASVTFKACKNGSLVDVFAAEVSTNNFLYIQGYTTIDVIYLGGNFIITDNPIVIHQTECIVRANGMVDGGNIGDVKPRSLMSIPYGWVEANGQEIDRQKYSELFTLYSTQTYDNDITHTLLSRYGAGDGSTTFNVPDYREVALVGAGQNTKDTTLATHDVYTVGRFRDDCFQDHNHNMFNANPGGSSAWVIQQSNGFYGNIETGLASSGRYSTVTHGKQKGVKYIIKVL